MCSTSLPDHGLNGRPPIWQGLNLLEKSTKDLLGVAPANRHVRIMVTMPAEAATKYELVCDLLSQGMDCMRINCAHDGPEAWSGMIRNPRRAEKEANRCCTVAMDLAGPKLRTGFIEPGPAVLKYRPHRDPCGHIVSPARIWLTSVSDPEVEPEPIPQPMVEAAETARPAAIHRRARGVPLDGHLGSQGRESLGRCRAHGLYFRRNDD